jgi:7-cyano-7-deazaguanine synthase
MKNTLLVYSGGLDSTSALYAYKDEIDTAVSFDYGSNHNHEEIKKAKINCELLGINHIVVKLDFKLFKSSLLGQGDIPEGRYDEEKMKSTVVPFRNGIMMSYATGLAESIGLERVMIASHAGDHTIYPDCTKPFNTSMNQAVSHGTNFKVKLLFPFEDIDKKEVAKIGLSAGMKPNLTYSCYKGGEVQCGVCSTCRERDWTLGLRNEP